MVFPRAQLLVPSCFSSIKMTCLILPTPCHFSYLLVTLTFTLKLVIPQAWRIPLNRELSKVKTWLKAIMWHSTLTRPTLFFSFPPGKITLDYQSYIWQKRNPDDYIPTSVVSRLTITSDVPMGGMWASRPPIFSNLQES